MTYSQILYCKHFNNSIVITLCENVKKISRMSIHVTFLSHLLMLKALFANFNNMDIFAFIHFNEYNQY